MKVRRKPKFKKKIKYWSCGKKGYYTNKYRLKDKKLTNLVISKVINIKKYLLNNSKLLNKKVRVIIRPNIKIKANISTLISW